MQKLLPWFRLKSVPGVGNHLFKRLIEQFTLPENVFSASAGELLQVEGVSHRLLEAIRHHRLADDIHRELDLVQKKGYRVVTMRDSAYPRLLREIPDPPPYLYVFGHLESTIRNVAVVGSRHATHYGLATTKRLCAELVALDMNVVSGMARGIDTAAHEGALARRGNTVAVLGSGLERIYPAENRNLFRRISEKGAVISEFSLFTEPEAYNFPARNRIISGMSLGTVVVEATKKSGSLITARLAADQNREVFAVPGSVQSFKSTGTHTLIKNGAKLVENAMDIMEELTFILGDTPPKFPDDSGRVDKALPSLSAEENLVYEALNPYPVHIDELVRKLSIPPGRLSSILLNLELKGLVHQASGKLFSVLLD